MNYDEHKTKNTDIDSLSIYFDMFASLDIGIALHKICLDEEGKPIGYIFIDVNPVFELITGLNKEELAGKRVLEVIPNTEEYWIQEYGEVALTGKTKNFRNYSKGLGKFFEVCATCPKFGYFTVIIKDFSLGMFLDNTKDILYRITYTPVLKFDYVSPSILQLCGYNANSFYDDAEILSIIMHHDDKPLLQYVFSPKPHYFNNPITTRWVHKDGHTIWVEHKNVVIYDNNGEILALEGIARDVTDRELAKQRIEQEKELLSITLASIADGVIATDCSNNIVSMNRVAQELTEWTEELAKGKPLTTVFITYNEKTNEAIENPQDLVLNNKDRMSIPSHISLFTKNGKKLNISFSAASMKDKGNNTIGTVVAFRDITEQKNIEKELTFLSYNDKLTGLYNRAFFEAELRRLDVKRQLPLSIIMGDVNGLKMVNDTFGHLEGDNLLRKAAEFLKRACRREDIICRLGGDEFVILLPKTKGGVAENIINRIKGFCREDEGFPIKTSIALGYSTKSTEEQDIYFIFKEAEDRMYRNKLSEVKSSRSSIISSLHKSLWEKTHETEEHTQRLQELTMKLGLQLGLSDVVLSDLFILAALHDIGKIGIPDQILNKKARLSLKEWEIMKKHPEIGYRIAQSAPELSPIADKILSHHERWDGNGYPQGLKGEEIPLISRILSIVDAYDVMTNGRPYQPPLSQDEAMEEIRRCAGTQFDPNIVEIFIKSFSTEIDASNF
jgi:diguanylate cyclase (GGDEF)-like protein/PAS domain S-box-containing protein